MCHVSPKEGNHTIKVVSSLVSEALGMGLIGAGAPLSVVAIVLLVWVIAVIAAENFLPCFLKLIVRILRFCRWEHGIICVFQICFFICREERSNRICAKISSTATSFFMQQTRCGRCRKNEVQNNSNKNALKIKRISKMSSIISQQFT